MTTDELEVTVHRRHENLGSTTGYPGHEGLIALFAVRNLAKSPSRAPQDNLKARQTPERQKSRQRWMKAGRHTHAFNRQYVYPQTRSGAVGHYSFILDRGAQVSRQYHTLSANEPSNSSPAIKPDCASNWPTTAAALRAARLVALESPKPCARHPLSVDANASPAPTVPTT